MHLEAAALSGANQYSVKPLALVRIVTPPIVAVLRVTPAPSALNFANQNVGTTSSPQAITLTNTGNGSDSFTLTLAPAQSGAFTLTGTHIYLDANGDGIPDNFADLTGTQVVVTPGAVNAFKFVITGTVPGGATAGQTNNFSVTATSVFDNTKAASNTDITTVTPNAVINVGDDSITLTFITKSALALHGADVILV